ncbi:hypothetical protein LINPERPRIM_LOCUS31624 [Linum perenne]
MSTSLKKDLRKDAAKSIGRWFYLTGTSFNAAREPEYYTMFELAARHGPGFKPPSYYEIRETLLKEELEEVEAKLSIFRNEWIKLEDLEKKFPVHKTTIAKGKTITNYIYGRAMLISMLKEFTKGGELIRLAVTRFATAYLTLGCLSEHKAFSSTREGKRIQGIAIDSRFWISVLTCLCTAMPLMKVLCLVDLDESPLMPFLYLDLNQAMEKIKSNFSNIEKSPLYYAAYWLNPKVHFSANFNHTEKKLKLGLYDCVERSSKDRDESLTIVQQLDTFHHARGMFSSYGSMQLLDKKHPADWWSSFGDDVPELQKFTIRILSLTCSASGCERN